MTHFAYSGHFGWIVSWPPGLVFTLSHPLRNTGKSTEHNLDLAFIARRPARGLRGLYQEPGAQDAATTPACRPA
jgi:hypothetical protein